MLFYVLDVLSEVTCNAGKADVEAATAAPVGDSGKAVDFAKITIAEAFKTLKVCTSSCSTILHTC